MWACFPAARDECPFTLTPTLSLRERGPLIGIHVCLHNFTRPCEPRIKSGAGFEGEGDMQRSLSGAGLDLQGTDLFVVAFDYGAGFDFEPVFEDLGVDASEVEVEGEVALYEGLGGERRVV